MKYGSFCLIFVAVLPIASFLCDRAYAATSYPGWDWSRSENGQDIYCPSKEMVADWPRSPLESCRPEPYVQAHPWAPAGQSPAQSYAPQAGAPRVQIFYCSTYSFGGRGWRYYESSGNACPYGYSPFYPAAGFVFHIEGRI